MSMLAERRRKTKWVINPSKKPIWTTDSEGIKLGKQLMEKMGWSAGKGLGANEQGIQEPLKVFYKNDTKGMGFKGNDEDWMEHQDEFNSLLSQLSSSDGSKPAEVHKNEIKSLEEKSKRSRARVHYQKFTRGKDLSRYSETDLACILGINLNKKQKDSLEEKNQVKEIKDDSYETSFGVTTINSGSILDYFKKKWTTDKSKENNSSSNTPDEVTQKDASNNTEELTPEHEKLEKLKINKLYSENAQVPQEKTIKTLEEVENSELGEEVKKIKKSKKRKLCELNDDNAEVPENETDDVSKEVENICSSEVEKESKKHKKSTKKKEDINIESKNVSKVHKKEKYCAGSSNQIEENNQDIQIQVTAGTQDFSNDNNLSLDNKKFESLQLSRENSEDGDENFTKKRKKDKKKHKIKESDTPEKNLQSVQGDFDHKIKKKKRKEKEGIIQNEFKEVIGKSYSDIGKRDSSVTENGEANGDENNQKLDLIEYNAMQNAMDLESEKSRKEKRKEKHKLDHSELANEEGLKIKCGIAAKESKSKNKKRKGKLTDQLTPENKEGQEIKAKSILEEVGSIVKEKKKKEKYKTNQSELENENEQETKTKSTFEKKDESEIKEKKKKVKHRSDQSTLENQEERVKKNKRASEEVELKVKGKSSKKNKLSETKKSEHKIDSEGICNSNINSESVEKINDDKQNERLSTKVKEDCKKLTTGNKQDESKTVENSKIHSHKIELFKKKKNISLLGKLLKNSPNYGVMGLIFGAEFQKFKGSNLENLVGYGMQKKTQGRDDG